MIEPDELLFMAVTSNMLEDVLENIHISDIAKKALLRDEGTLGMLYKVVRDIEEFNINAIVDFSKKHKLKAEEIQEIILQSIEDVNSFESSLKAS